VAAQNVGGKMIHSTLKIKQTGDYYTSLSQYDPTTKNNLSKIQAIIIEEISMVSANLFTFISNLFASIHQNSKIFGGIPTLIMGDLAQLPPIDGLPRLFFPLFLHQPQRQRDDPTFFKILQELRFGHLTEPSKNLIKNKINSSSITQNTINSTYLVGLRQSSNSINEILCKNLPLNHESLGPIISLSIDTLNHTTLTTTQQNSLHFNHHTNLPEQITLQESARVIYLNNKLFEHEICNGTVGIITKIINTENIEVTFSTSTTLTRIVVQKETSYFNINGLTLPHATVSIDQGIFAPEQAYVAMSRATSWNNLDILSFEFDTVKTDHTVISEYARLAELNRKGLNQLTSNHQN
ncbi:3981_t:CDS:2, partial [Ambispora leptoticha]